MRIALLIHVHTNSVQVGRLVSRLRHEDVDIYINVDAKVDIEQFRHEVKDVAIFLQNRVEVRWGRFSQVQQILNSFEEIISKKKKYSHILFISGSDYPVRPIGEIVEYLNKNAHKSFIDYHMLKDDEWSKLMKKRYEYWYFLPERDIRNNKWVKRILQKIGFKRKYPFPVVYYGSCWFCPATDAIEYLLDYTKRNPQVVSFFKNSGCSDELYIQSVLLNSPLKDSIVNQIYRYFDWSAAGKSPKILTMEDYPSIDKSGAWFARKLDINIDTELFDELDKKNSLPENERE